MSSFLRKEASKKHTQNGPELGPEEVPRPEAFMHFLSTFLRNQPHPTYAAQGPAHQENSHNDEHNRHDDFEDGQNVRCHVRGMEWFGGQRTTFPMITDFRQTGRETRYPPVQEQEQRGG